MARFEARREESAQGSNLARLGGRNPTRDSIRRCSCASAAGKRYLDVAERERQLRRRRTTSSQPWRRRQRGIPILPVAPAVRLSLRDVKDLVLRGQGRLWFSQVGR